MNQPIKIIQARLPGFPDLREVNINSDGLIASCHTFTQSKHNDEQVIDLEGDWLSLGGVDLQINGALGLAFTDLQQPEELAPICEFLATKTSCLQTLSKPGCQIRTRRRMLKISSNT